MKSRSWFIPVMLASLIFVGFFAGSCDSQKEMVIETDEITWFPEIPEDEGETHAIYRVYYVWDGKQDEQPWWVILESPLHDFEWVCVEVAELDDITDADKGLDAFARSAVFDENWFDNECYHVQRSSLWKFRHALFGTDDFTKEQETLAEVLNRIRQAQ